MLSRVILAAIAVSAVALRPKSRGAAVVALAAGSLSALVAGWGVAADTVRSVAPMLAFLTVALGLAALAERAGLSDRAAVTLARVGQGRGTRIYGLVCLTSAALTFVVSLDGAVVLMVPVVRALARRCRLAQRPLFVGAVAVANAASLAVPEGNPTNLAVMSRLGLSPAAFLGHLFLPGLAAAAFCALVPVRAVRPELGDSPEPLRAPLLVPWRIGAQMAGLLASLDGLAPALSLSRHGLASLLAVAAGTAAASALANNLPISASVAAFATSGQGVYAALIGLSVGALATAHGSVATLIARDLAGDARPWARTWAVPAVTAVVLSTLLLWLLS